VEQQEVNNVAFVILAAGKGTRMNSDLPKVLHAIAGKPMLWHVIKTVSQLLPEKIFVIVGHKSDMVRRKMSQIMKKSRSVTIRFVKQERLLGTADAVKSVIPLLKKFDGNIIIMCGDTPLIKPKTLSGLLDVHNEQNNILTLLTANLGNPHGYGRIIRDNNGNVLRIDEELDLSEEQKQIKEINSGIYCINNKILLKSIGKIKKNPRKQEFYLTDIVKVINGLGKKVGATKVDDINEITGINTIHELERVNKLFCEGDK
jgi:UDP-N-acetylglucosamine diphosphorylase/glucosamine-1-phosphate N-acetyltransferase